MPEGLPALLKMMARPGHNGPLYFVVMRGWRAATGDTEFALRYFSVAGGVLMAALTFRVGRKFGLGRGGATVAVALIATSPYLVWYSQEAKMYTWLACLILAAVYAFRSALTAPKPARRWAAFAMASSLSFYTHILAPLMLGVYLAWAALEWPRLKPRLRGWLAAMALLTLPYLPLAAWQFDLLRQGFDSGHPLYPLHRQAWLLLHFYSAGILRHPYSPYLMGGTIVLALLGLLAPAALPGPARRAQLAVWLLIPATAAFLISLRVTVFEDRYLIYLAPPFYLLLATGIVALSKRVRGAGLPALALLLAFNGWGIYRQANQPIKADFRSAAAYIARSAAPAPPGLPPPPEQTALPFKNYLPLVAAGGDAPPLIMFQMPYLQRTFDYYFQQPFRPLQGAWTNDGRDPASVAAEMRRKTGAAATLWLVVAEEDYWDSRHLTRQWLSEHAVLTGPAAVAVGIDD
ncbi:MAG: hypothetical protein ACE5G8_16660, partial [Anaerolineae bacterium]